MFSVIVNESPVTSRKNQRSSKNVLDSGAQKPFSGLFDTIPEDPAEEALANCTLNVSLDEDRIQEESAVDLSDEDGPLPKVSFFKGKGFLIL